MSDLIRFSGSEIEFNGEFFRGSPAVKLKDNLARHVGKLADDGRKYVVRQIANRPVTSERARLPGRRRTGFTQRNIEAYQNPPNSLYAKVRMKPGVERPNAKATARYPAKRIPYVVTAVLETGKRNGSYRYVVRVGKNGLSARTRKRWQSGKAMGGQTGVYAFRNAARVMRQRAPSIRESILLKGLE